MRREDKRRGKREEEWNRGTVKDWEGGGEEERRGGAGGREGGGRGAGERGSRHEISCDKVRERETEEPNFCLPVVSLCVSYYSVREISTNKELYFVVSVTFKGYECTRY